MHLVKSLVTALGLLLTLNVTGCRIEREARSNETAVLQTTEFGAEQKPEDAGPSGLDLGPKYDSWSSTQLRIMTFNVRFLLASADEAKRLMEKGLHSLDGKVAEDVVQQHHEELAQMIAHHQPDIVCLQEVINEAALERLVKTLETEEAYYTPFFVNSGSTFLEQDVVFLTKSFPDKTSDERIYRPSATSKAAVLELEFHGQKFAFLGLHLLARPDDVTRKARRETEANQVAQVLNQLREKGLTPIVMGDFNDWDRETPDTAVEVDPITSVFEILRNYDANTEGQELFNAAEYIDDLDQRYTHIYRGRYTMLDHILLPNELRGSLARTFIEHRNQNISDHRPVMVDLQF